MVCVRTETKPAYGWNSIQTLMPVLGRLSRGWSVCVTCKILFITPFPRIRPSSFGLPSYMTPIILVAAYANIRFGLSNDQFASSGPSPQRSLICALSIMHSSGVIVRNCFGFH